MPKNGGDHATTILQPFLVTTTQRSLYEYKIPVALRRESFHQPPTNHDEMSFSPSDHHYIFDNREIYIILTMKLGFLSVAAALMCVAEAINVGDKIPDHLELHVGFKPKTINLAEYIKGRDVILMGLPGAFTPT